MAKKKQNLTPNQQAFKKEQQRIQRTLRRAEKKGYIFEDNVVPSMPKRVTNNALKNIKSIKGDKLYSRGEKLDRETGELVKGKTARKEERKASAKKAQATKKRKKAGIEDIAKGRVKPRSIKRKKKTIKDYANMFTYGTDDKGLKQRSKEYNSNKYDSNSKEYNSSVWDDIIISNFLAEIKHFPESAYPVIESWLNETISRYGKYQVAYMLEEGKQNGLIMTGKIAYDDKLLTDFMIDMINYLPELGALEKEQLEDLIQQNEYWNDVE